MKGLPSGAWLTGAPGLGKALILSAGLHLGAGGFALLLVPGTPGEPPGEGEFVLVQLVCAPAGEGQGGAQGKSRREKVPFRDTGAPSPETIPSGTDPVPARESAPPRIAVASASEPVLRGTDSDSPTVTPDGRSPEPPGEGLSSPSAGDGRGRGDGNEEGGGREGGPGSGPEGAGEAALGIGAPFLPASALDLPRPRYPEAARLRGQEGTVLLAVMVGEGGAPAEVTVVSSSGSSLLDRAACDAARLARFAPARRGDRPVPSTRQVAFTFRLTEDQEE